MKRILFFIFVFFVHLTSKAYAHSEVSPYSYSKVVGNGKYVFVMLAPGEKEIRSASGEAYPSSGLYPDDGSANPVWKVDWFSANTYITDDGSCVVRIIDKPRLNSGNKKDLAQLALGFYKDGQLTAEYSLANLIYNSLVLPKSSTHFDWIRKVAFDDSTKELSIITYEDNKYIFDITTGKILNNSLPNKLRGMIVNNVTTYIVLFSLVFISAIAISFKRRKTVKNITELEFYKSGGTNFNY